MPSVTTLPVSSAPLSRPEAEVEKVHVLVLAWSATEPWRVGEIAVLPAVGEPQVLGRGRDEPAEARVHFFRQRPGSFDPGPPLAGAGISRRQLVIAVKDGGLVIENVGQRELCINGVRSDRGVVRPGDTLHIQRQLVLLYTRRAAILPGVRYFPRASWGEFGEPDGHGILGESPAAWLLREQLAFVAKSGTHALLVGASGSGKELAARAIHALSGRASRPFVARNAATLPAGLIDAELFGNARNYPNAGMPDRPGLVGQADGGTLFLDEIAELPVEQQSHLLRVLDAGGEYQRLGEATTRRSDLRLVGATNRDPSVLKHDLRARLTTQVDLAPLSARREDIPLLARHLLFAAAKRSPEVAGRFVDTDGQGRLQARFAASFIEHVLRQEFETNTRQLETTLWKAISEAPGNDIIAPREALSASAAPPTPQQVRTDRSTEPSADEIQAALVVAGGSVSKAARSLRVSSRYALYRLMKKHGIGDEGSSK
jgi:DNA-binding NtrC family response regulator